MDTILISSTLITILLLLIGFSFFLVLRKKIRREEKSNKALVQSLISNLKEKEKRNEKQERELKNRENILIKEQLILTKELADISRERKKIESKKISLEAQQKNLEKKQQEIARITEEEAKEIIIQRVKKTLKNYTTNSIIQQQNDLKEKRKKLTVNVICSAIEKIAKDIVNAEEQDETINLSFEKKITIEGDVNKQKGRLIGREGRNIKALQEISGTEINFSGPAGEIINISSFNPLRRLLAYETILRLLSYHVVHPKKVEDTWNRVKVESIEIIRTEAEKAIREVKLDVKSFSANILEAIGKLATRTSYGQSVLIHSIEVAKISSVIAAELEVDQTLAARAGLLHDIGKSVSFEKSKGSHIIDGIRLTTEAKEYPEVIEAIRSHHDETMIKSIYGVIVRTADSLSAGRKGARVSATEQIVKRIHEIEKTLEKITEIENFYVLQGGRSIRVIVKPDQINDNNILDFLEQIKQLLSSLVEKIPGEITLTIIREKRINTIIEKLTPSRKRLANTN